MMHKDALEKIIEGEVSNEQDILQKAANDASIFEVMPSLVVFPSSSEDIQKIVRYVAEHKEQDPSLSITARAAGTGMSGGSLTESVVLDLTRHMNTIKRVADTHGVVQPGTYYRDFEKATLQKGVLMPSYPASKEICAIGGMVANNAGGEKTLSYGSTVRYVKGLKVILSDGNEYEFGPLDNTALDGKMAQSDFEGDVYRRIFALIENNRQLIEDARPKVSKNSTGYFIWDVYNGATFDLSKLFV